MSGLVAIVDNIEGPRSNRTKSVDAILYNDNDLLTTAISNGEVTRSSSRTASFRLGEVLLSNGELYSGSLLGNIPEGAGTYTWSDSTRYEGEWRRGMRHGYGKLQWASGADYEGEFSGGYMNGTGTYIGSDQITYKGRWRLNLKHGLGYQIYPNGDVFEGSWIQGTPEGPGKYTWVNGNMYLGNMKAGKMSGKGTITWSNGDSYEGSWSNGMMHGFGVYTWCDSGCYVGTWTRGLKDGKGTFYPKGARFSPVQELYLKALRKRGLLPDLRKQSQVSHIQQASSIDMGNIKLRGSQRKAGALLNLVETRPGNVSLERRWSLEVAIEKVIGHDVSYDLMENNLEETDVDPTAPILEREYMQGVLISELVLNDSFSFSKRILRRRKRKLAREVKRPGEAIIKGHRVMI